MKICENKKKVIYYILGTILYWLIGVISIVYFCVAMIYLMYAESFKESLIGMIMLVGPIVISTIVNWLAIETKKDLKIKSNKHIIVWNSITVLTFMLLYFTV